MKSYVIHFIRHGAIDETLSGKYIGATDVPLSGQGKAALQRLAQEHAYPRAQVVFTSPLKRCTETCRILYPDISPLAIANLSECNFGEWEGKTAEEVMAESDNEITAKTVGETEYQYFEYDENGTPGHTYMYTYNGTTYTISFVSSADISALEQAFMNNVRFGQ